MKLRHTVTFVWAIPAILLISMLLMAVPQPARASVPTHEWTMTGPIPNIVPGGMACKELTTAAGWTCITGVIASLIPGWDGLAWMAGKVILHELSQNIVEWIRSPGGNYGTFFSGGTEGSLFVTNVDQFLLDAADNAASVFLEQYYGDAWNQLCTPFRLQVGLGLSRSYGRDYGSYKFQAKCTIQDIVANVEDFYESFENGGWEAWLSTALYANNPWGSLTLGREVSRSMQSRASSANLYDFIAGQAFPGLRECPPDKQLPGATQNGQPLCQNNGYITKTPGKVIEDLVAKGPYEDNIRSLEMADEIDEILYAAFQALLTWILSGGSDDGLLGADVRNAPPPGHGNRCSGDTGRGLGCSCTLNSQCASNFCSPSSNTCAPPTPSAPQCSDGLDNDGDGLIDLADPDCTSAADTTEGSGDGGPPPPPPPPGILPPPDTLPPPPPPPAP